MKPNEELGGGPVALARRKVLPIGSNGNDAPAFGHETSPSGERELKRHAFPRDQALPLLSRLVNAEQVREWVLERREPLGLPDGAKVRSVDVERIRHRHGKHCLLRYRIHFEDPTDPAPETGANGNGPTNGHPNGDAHDGDSNGGPSVEPNMKTKTIYCKAYAGPLGDYVHRVMRSVWEHPDRPAILGIPRPIAYVREAGAVWQEEWPGVRIGGSEGQPGIEPGPSRALVDIAHLLAGLHTLRGLPVRLRPARSASQAHDDARKDAAGIASFYPIVGTRLAAIVDRLACTVPAPRRAPRAVLHGTFKLSQLLRAPDGRLGLIDFDSASRGDPHHDLAEFLASYHYRTLTRGWSNLSVQDGAEHFLDAYQRAVPWRCDGTRLSWFMTAFLLGKVHSSLQRLEWTERGQVEGALDLISKFSQGGRW